MFHAEFRDPLLVAVYDAEFPWSYRDDFFLSVVEEPAQRLRVLDLGCGTGRLALGIAAAGHTVTGVDPATASLDAARAKPGAEKVTWLEGTSRDLPDEAFDVAVMSSHVAQFFVTDEAWAEVLADLRRSLVPGGRIVFDARDPRPREWEEWTPAGSLRQVTLPDGREVTLWDDTTEDRPGVVSFTQHYRFPDGGELLSTGTLAFRGEDDLRASLRDAGFTVERIYGGWHREPVGSGDGEFLVVAHT
ncbi:class I SAM-dependent methyltransferase [Kitasatospora sp. NPDC002551]|uniref:class I SAM-dependent methyltransferase n=1 Tax=unclassified Kitasatospora TaxID=2633591 RepID=UPI00332EED7A